MVTFAGNIHWIPNISLEEQGNLIVHENNTPANPFTRMKVHWSDLLGSQGICFGSKFT